jgi:membrane protein DedA with SNARE-associated domain
VTVFHVPSGLADLASITNNLLDRVLVFRRFWAYAIVGLLCFGEATFMLGFVLPGETAVIIGGVLASRSQVGLPLMVTVVAVCAIVGDSVGHEVGKHTSDSGSSLSNRCNAASTLSNADATS